MSVLFLRLSGPMQAWGTQSRFSVRDTGLEPSKSGVLGLLCAALGKPREESLRPDLPSLASMASLRMAVRVDRPGTLASDYQTAMNVVKASSIPGKTPDLKPCEPSRRYYLSDAEFLVGLEGPLDLLRRLDSALADPVWPLYLGRKSFVPSAPVRVPGGLMPDGRLPEALKTQPWWYRSPGERPKEPPRIRIVTEADGPVGGDVRNDVPLTFVARDRRFLARRVRDAELWTVSPEDLIRSWPPCTSRN